jgi:signal peptidase I, bacterial type
MVTNRIKKIKGISLFICVSLVFFLLFVRLEWLAIIIGGIYSVLLLFSSSLRIFKWIRQHKIILIGFFLFGMLMLAIVIRIFVYEFFTVPSSSMENTLLPGDKVMVNKLCYGPRMPRSPYEIPWISLFFYLKKDATVKAETNWWGYKRLNGGNTIKRDDVVAFNFPDKKEELYVKRCIGMPGDTFEIIGGQTYINHKLHYSPSKSKMPYRLNVKNFGLFQNLIDSLDVKRIEELHFQGTYAYMILQNDLVSRLTSSSSIDSILPEVIKANEPYQSFPWNQNYNWNYDFFGPLVIPRKGMTINFNVKNLILYKKIIDSFEKQPVELSNGIFLINKRSVKQYTFKQDYYFMMGDNRHDSNDSRMWGFVPEEYIYGKVTRILYNSEKTPEGHYRWNRIFKTIK